MPLYDPSIVPMWCTYDPPNCGKPFSWVVIIEDSSAALCCHDHLQLTIDLADRMDHHYWIFPGKPLTSQELLRTMDGPGV